MHNKRDGFLKTYLQNSNLIYILRKSKFYKLLLLRFDYFTWVPRSRNESAFAFNKPIIFFSENDKFFKDSYFFFDKKQNENILFLINQLTFNGEKFLKSIDSKSEYKKFKSEIENHTKELFRELEFNNLISAQSSINKIINE